MSRQAKRQCDKCHMANNSIFPVCNDCRADGCLHQGWHYNSNHAKVCDHCGVSLTDNIKKVGHANRKGVFPGAMMSQYRPEDL